MERISGPYKGYFIAAYTVDSGNSFAGYAKVCMEEPTSVWSADTVERLTSATGFRTELEAVTAAEQKARRIIADLTSGWENQSTFPGTLEG